jgi:NADH-quinone oxidoreductase subunit C
MTADQIQNTIKERLKEDVLSIALKGEKRLFVSIDPGQIVNTARFMFTGLECRFIIATALQTKQGFDIYYHFSKDDIGLIINLHVIIPVDHPEIQSLANDFVAANWIEREMHELYGINFLNHPNLEKLISDGNWAEGVYPYRKE